MEAIQNQGGIRTMLFDSPYVSLAHIAGSPENLLFLVIRETFIEEKIDCIPTLTFADPHDAGTVQVIDNSSVLMALTIGDLIYTDGPQCPDPMAFPQSGDALMKETRESGGGDPKEMGGGLLSHYLTVHEQGMLKPIGDTGIGVCPGDIFLNAAVGGTEDLLGLVAEEHFPSTNREIPPHPHGGADVDNFAPAPTLGASAPLFVRPYKQIQFSIPMFELVITDKNVFQMKQGYDKLPDEGHRFPPFLGFDVLEIGMESMTFKSSVQDPFGLSLYPRTTDTAQLFLDTGYLFQ